jgi:hypothetical protein
MRILASPALHFIIVGALIFAAVLFSQGAFSARERARIVIPNYRIALARAEFENTLGRPPTAEENRNIVDTIVDREVLYRYALDLGLHKQKVVEERLSQIARFVEENPHEPKSKAERALDALDLGLHEGDLVVRRILVDGARRLIRAPVLMRLPSDEMLEAYLRENGEKFMIPGKTRITHVTVNELKYGKDTGKHANELLSKIKSENLSPEEATALEPKAFIESVLPPLPDKEIERKFGYRFTNELQDAPVGEWSGPIPSRYGVHLVYIHERTEPYVPPLKNIRKKVKGRLLHKLAAEWLDLRLEQLKQEYDIVIEEAKTS